MKEDFRWEEPAERPSRTRNEDIRRLAERCKDRPGSWARLCTVTDRNRATGLYGTVRRMKDDEGSWEARIRTVDGEVAVYGRYVKNEEGEQSGK